MTNYHALCVMVCGVLTSKFSTMICFPSPTLAGSIT